MPQTGRLLSSSGTKQRRGNCIDVGRLDVQCREHFAEIAIGNSCRASICRGPAEIDAILLGQFPKGFKFICTLVPAAFKAWPSEAMANNLGELWLFQDAAIAVI